MEGQGGQGGMWEYWGVLERMGGGGGGGGNGGEGYEVVVLADGVVELGEGRLVEGAGWVGGGGGM